MSNIRIPISLFDIIKDDKGHFKIQVNNDRAAIVNYGLNRLADSLLEVAKSWTFKGLDEHWKKQTAYDKKSHLIKSIVFRNDAPEVIHTGGLATSDLWNLMDVGRIGWRRDPDAGYTFDTYPDSPDAQKKAADRISDRRGKKKFDIATSRNRGTLKQVGRARLGDIYPTKPEFWVNYSLNIALEKFINQIEEAQFGEVGDDFVSFGGAMPGVELIPNLYELSSERGDLDVAEDPSSFLYGNYGGSHREDIVYGKAAEPWYASYY